jgi:acid phosphatase type 7
MPRTLAVSVALAIVVVSSTAATTAAAETPPSIAAAGDIACAPNAPHFNDGRGEGPHCRMLATSRLLVDGGFDGVLTLGDNQYPNGRWRQFRAVYDVTWGAVKDITHPSVGNHEYGVPDAEGYFRYFGDAAGVAGQGWYSFDVGTWHLIALNSNCFAVGCARGSDQYAWLKSDLAASEAGCTLAYWHHPLFSSGEHGDNASVKPFWRLLERAGADVILNGHDHHYERFAPATVGGHRSASGIREFVVGTGGINHYGITHVEPLSQVRNDRTFGVLSLTLDDGSYSWEFLATGRSAFEDAGTGRCH